MIFPMKLFPTCDGRLQTDCDHISQGADLVKPNVIVFIITCIDYPDTVTCYSHCHPLYSLVTRDLRRIHLLLGDESIVVEEITIWPYRFLNSIT